MSHSLYALPKFAVPNRSSSSNSRVAIDESGFFLYDAIFVVLLSCGYGIIGLVIARLIQN